jgi:hypothetical protein
MTLEDVRFDHAAADLAVARLRLVHRELDGLQRGRTGERAALREDWKGRAEKWFDEGDRALSELFGVAFNTIEELSRAIESKRASAVAENARRATERERIRIEQERQAEEARQRDAQARAVAARESAARAAAEPTSTSGIPQ